MGKTYGSNKINDSIGKKLSSCRLCNTILKQTFADLGMTPLCERFLTKQQLNHMEPFYPLKAFVCEKCYLVQLDEYVPPNHIFNDYPYFSSYSDSWVVHAKNYVEMIAHRLQLSSNSKVFEIASNDGYLLQHFLDKQIPVLGIEPAANVAEAAIEKGIPTEIKFFGQLTARELVTNYGTASLLIGNNVLAHVPDLNDFIAGMSILLASKGVITMEFPHLMQLMQNTQFDTIYHEHFSYFSFLTVEKAFKKHGLKIFDVEQLKSHGGSLRIYACHENNLCQANNENTMLLRSIELAHNFDKIETYSNFQKKIDELKYNALNLLIELKRAGKSIVAYGAPGKGNTLLNYYGIREDFIDYAVDRIPYKHGRFTPGTHIPIFSPDKIKETKPDYLLILPWNLKKEIMATASYAREWDAKFIVLVPHVEVM